MRSGPPLSGEGEKSETPTRAIAFLAVAAFASQAMVRVADPLLPQIAADLSTTVGAASVITSVYALAHGAAQIFGMPLGDRFPKYPLVTAMCAFCAIAVVACGLSGSLAALGTARLACGLLAGTIIPLGMAFIGDTVPYERRQPVLGRFLAGQILGLVTGQIVGGVVGDFFGWRNVFFLIAGIFVAADVVLFTELIRNPQTRTPSRPQTESTGLIADYSIVFSSPWARIIILVSFVEFGVMFAAFAYIGADLHARAGLGFSAVGGVLAAFGVGGLAYVLSVHLLVARLGQIGLVLGGGALLALSYVALAVAPLWWVAIAAVAVIGLGFHMLHNTLQVNATQMAPKARATAIGIFSAALYLGQSAGVAAAAPIVDRFTAAPVFVAVAILFPLLAAWFAWRLVLQRRAQ
ncbi:MAG: MFS transporter [Rhizobiales bacterium]|nr:MFS transporter [Hyphomicrobiales bacterium]